MKRTLILAVAAVVLCGCASTQQAEADMSEAGKGMHAAFKACIKEELSRENAVEQIDCIGKAEIQAGYESRNPYMWNIERAIVADRASAIEYAEGKINKAAYMDALEQHWAEAEGVDMQERAKYSEGWLEQAEVHWPLLEVISE